MSAIDDVIAALDRNMIVYAEGRIRGDTLSIASQTDVDKMVRSMLMRSLADKLDPLHREFVDRRDYRGDIYKPGEIPPYEAFGPGRDMIIHGELFVLTRAQYDKLVRDVGQVKRELDTMNSRDPLP